MTRTYGEYSLFEHQSDCRDSVFHAWNDLDIDKVPVMLPTGCHDPFQEILMYDGTIKIACDIDVGDQLMGPDSTPRNVMEVHEGEKPMYRIFPVKGNPFDVTEDHPLSLIRTNETNDKKYPCDNRSGEIVDVSVKEWIGWSKWKKHIHKLFRVGVDFGKNHQCEFDPYLAGLLLGDGHLGGGKNLSISITTADHETLQYCDQIANRYDLRSRIEPAGGQAVSYYFSGERGQGNSLISHARKYRLWGQECGSKFVPQTFKSANRNDRALILAGLIDTDGHLNLSKGFDFVSKSEQLSNDVAFLARSLGLAAYVQSCTKGCQTGAIGTYYRVSISGDTDIVPCKIPRKISESRKQKKDVCRTGFSVEPLGIGDYYGFTVDGDHRYLLGDFTVTHNTGKTIIAGAIIHDFIKETGKRALFLNHRRELVRQTKAKFERMGIQSDIEMGDMRASKSGMFSSDVVIASIQSLKGDRLQSWPRNTFGLIVFDEVHHVVSEQAQRILAHFNGYKFLGVSATYDRNDRKSLGDFFTETTKPIYEFPLFDAIELGYLSELEIRRIKTDIDLKKIKKTAEGKDINLEEVSEQLAPMITGLCRDVFLKECGDLKTIIFAPSVRCSEAFAACLNSLGRRSRAVSSFDKDEWRKESLELFQNGEIQYLSNFGIFGEGFDEPSIEVGIGARPTTSRPLYAQMVGRVLRKHPGKQKAIWLDLAMTSENLNLVHPVDLFSTSKIDQETIERAKRLIDGNGYHSSKDLCKVVRDADAGMDDKYHAERRRLVVEAYRNAPRLDYTKTVAELITTQTCGLVRFSKWDNEGPFRATPAQCRLLRLYKVNQPEKLGRKGASKLIDAISTRMKRKESEPGSSTYAQLSFLLRNGVPEMEAKMLSRTKASLVIDGIIHGKAQKMLPGYQK